MSVKHYYPLDHSQQESMDCLINDGYLCQSQQLPGNVCKTLMDNQTID